ncbi:hypothetical protein ABB25_11605 [Stenotrophomonas koreensis]|uniref:Uncharacterized protein n=1 Tax=Stenotrophomonas koreensis TaxID=266128 RepID=A0A0R0BDY4_9GAMM|nr:hypothetical protein ABB25_11605 [Stenotrophomonas koreensis]
MAGSLSSVDQVITGINLDDLSPVIRGQWDAIRNTGSFLLGNVLVCLFIEANGVFQATRPDKLA